MPKRYGGRVTWTKHYVCCSDGLAFAPILDDPMPIDDYSLTVFGEDFPMERFVSEEAMQDYLRRSEKPASH